MRKAKIHYSSNFLTNVIFKIDFPKVLELGVGKAPFEFQNKIKDRFPVLEETPGKFVEFAVPKTVKDDLKITQEEVTKWDFYNKERTKAIVVTPNFISLEYLNYYNSFDEFLGDIDYGVKLFFDMYDVIKVINRMGLRYIN